MDDLKVRQFLASPRHAHFFATDSTVQRVIRERRDRLIETGMLQGKTPIVNIQEEAGIVELHDGNASAVAWLLYAKGQRLAATLGEFTKSFDRVIVLKDRVHPSGEVWHPFVPPDVACARWLQTAFDQEQGRQVRKAVTLKGNPILFDNKGYFSGVDASKKLGTIAAVCAQTFASND